MSKSETTMPDLNAYGWAPGMYVGGRCYDCKERMEGLHAKRAWRCLPCALKAKAEAQRIQECPMICDMPGVSHA